MALTKKYSIELCPFCPKEKWKFKRWILSRRLPSVLAPPIRNGCLQRSQNWKCFQIGKRPKRLKDVFKDFACIELYSFFRTDGDDFSSFRVSPFPFLSQFEFETSKSREGHSSPRFQRTFNSIHQGEESLLSLLMSNPRVF